MGGKLRQVQSSVGQGKERIMMDSRDYRSRVDRLLNERQILKRRMGEENSALTELTDGLKDIESAQTISQEVAQTIQQRVHRNIAEAVTRCLEAVFENPYRFSIRFDRKRGKTEAQLVLSRDGKDYEEALNEVGGGVVDVASLALRLACVLLSRPTRSRLLVLDEPFRNVRGAANKRALRSMLESLADDLGFQFILNVDAEAYPEFALGTIIELG